jgi:ADP-ribose pyrophosphatase
MRPKIVGKENIEYKSSRLQIASAKIKFPGNKPAKWSYAELPDAVLVLPMDKKGNVYLVKEWRLAWKREVLQIPGGICHDRTEKARVAQAHNELREEIGMDAKTLKKLSTYYAGAVIKHQPHVYLATNLFPASKLPDENEFVTIVKMPFEKAYKLFIEEGEMTTSATLIGFLLARRTLSR